MKAFYTRFAACAGLATMLMTAGCAVVGHEGHRYDGEKYLDARTPSGLDTLGPESSDLESACNRMVGKLLAHPLMNRSPVPLFVVDASNFEAAIQTNFRTEALADLARNELLNAGAGRLRILYTAPDTISGADYALGGRVTDLVQTSGSHGESYTQIAFEVIDLRTNEIVFSDLYSFKKAGSIAPTLY